MLLLTPELLAPSPGGFGVVILSPGEEIYKRSDTGLMYFRSELGNLMLFVRVTRRVLFLFDQFLNPVEETLYLRDQGNSFFFIKVRKIGIIPHLPKIKQVNISFCNSFVY